MFLSSVDNGIVFFMVFAVQARKAGERQNASLWPDAKGWCPKIGILSWEHTDQARVGSAAVENAARRAAVAWPAKADFPVEGSYKGWSSGVVGSGVSISTYAICCSSAPRGWSVGKVLPGDL